ncbi:MAG: hypothetical protein KGH57_02275 [Candidatus Micrarchaeota archaeon]|nr:hypothetical protein [Candidatus Micrarchaeota archaeon]
MRMRIEGAARAALTGAVALGFALFIYSASGVNDFLALCVLVVLGSLSLACMQALIAANAEAYRRKCAQQEFTDYLHGVLYRRRAGMPYAKALAHAAQMIGYAPLKERVLLALRRRFMQGDHGGNPTDIGDGKWAAAELRKELQLEAASQAKIDESAQRYATLNMFVSTVLPSFMVFAFIGSSILSRGSFGLLLFSSILLFALPLSYSFGNLLMWRCLLA